MIQTRVIPESIPVTTNGIPIRNLWYMLSYSWKDRRLLKRWKADVEAAPSLDGLLAKMLVNLVSQRIRIGLGRNYRPDERTMAGIRGRVDFATCLKKLTFQNAKAHCRFHIFDTNVTRNQIIRSTLSWIASRGDFGPRQTQADQLRHEVRSLVQQLGHIDLIEVRPSIIRRQQMQRDDHDYRLMLTLCNLILSQQMPTETEGSEQSHGLDRDWKFVWRLFESFVANFFMHHLNEWKVKPQHKMNWPAENESRFLPAMKPDIVLFHRPTKHRVILDTKMTANCLKRGQYDCSKFNTAHIYQLYSYLRSQEHRWPKLTGVLLYPAVEDFLSESVHMNDHTMRWETIDLTQDWPLIEKDLISLAASFLTQRSTTRNQS